MGPREPLHVLLVEDDPGDALLVQALLEDGPLRPHVTQVGTLAAALERSHQTDCILLDLGLPDAKGLAALEAIIGVAPDVALVVLTGADSTALGMAALGAGAQDYLVKGQVDEDLLARSVRYAVERQRTVRMSRQLLVAARLRAENARLERALTPRPMVSSPDVDIAVRYEAGREGAELGGDFYDAVELPSGELRLLVGDVCGHGPDEAALGAILRGGWRALTLAGHDQRAIVATLDQVIRQEAPGAFATACLVCVDPDHGRADLLLAGHPPPIRIGLAVELVGEEGYGSLIGLLPEPEWRETTQRIDPGDSLLLYTDGLIEGRAAPFSRHRLGLEEVVEVVAAEHRRGHHGESLLDALLLTVEERNGGPLGDDVALCLVTLHETSLARERRATVDGLAR